MKVVHVTTSTFGGAGTATMRIHRALRAAGVDSWVLCVNGEQDERVMKLPPSLPRFWERAAFRAGISLRESFKADARRERAGITSGSFSAPFSDYDIASHPLVRNADIVNLHWVGGLLDWPSFFGDGRKRVAWTLHDLNPAMGGFHYETDKARSTAEARKIDDGLARTKAAILKSFEKLHVVGPSSWIAGRSRSSATLGAFPHSVIRNPIDPDDWKPQDRNFARSFFDLPDESCVLLTAAEKAGDFRKGADILESSLISSGESGAFMWAAAGSATDLPSRAKALGSLSDPRMMALAYSAADFFVVPSREDNLPNVILESHSIGTPVIGLPAGGIPEIITDSVNGALAAGIDSTSLGDALVRATSIRFDRVAIRDRASEDYAPRKIASEYITVYESLLS